MKLFYEYIVIFFNLSPTSNHFHPLQVENCDSNSQLVVVENDNGKFRLERVKSCFLPEYAVWAGDWIEGTICSAKPCTMVGHLVRNVDCISHISANTETWTNECLKLKSSKTRWFYFGFLIWPDNVNMFIDWNCKSFSISMLRIYQLG